MMGRRIWVVALLAVMMAAAAIAQHIDLRDSASLSQRFGDANTRYEQGDYEGAIELYHGVENEGVKDPDLFYNLANAYYKTQDLGRTVLYYERSLALRPRSRDVRDNLELVRAQLHDKQFVKQQNRVVRAVLWFHNNLSTREMAAYISATWAALCLVSVVLILRDTRVVRKIYTAISVVSPGRLLGLGMVQDLVLTVGVIAILVSTSGISALRKMDAERSRSQAVVLTEEIAVYSSPTGDATLQFKIHSGTMVNIVERRADWVRIQLPGKLSGWVESEAVESV